VGIWLRNTRRSRCSRAGKRLAKGWWYHSLSRRSTRVPSMMTRATLCFPIIATNGSVMVNTVCRVPERLLEADLNFDLSFPVGNSDTASHEFLAHCKKPRHVDAQLTQHSVNLIA
jgi:hypothetical protein